jgi:hypothetical protein
MEKNTERAMTFFNSCGQANSGAALSNQLKKGKNPERAVIFMTALMTLARLRYVAAPRNDERSSPSQI